MPLLAAAVLQVQAAAFAPPLGVPIRAVTTRTQGEGAQHFTVRIERMVRFARDGAGYRAEVVLLDAAPGPQGDVGAMLQAGFAGLAGRTMTVRLDAAGKLLSVDDRQALWDRFCASVVAMIVARHGHGTTADRQATAQAMATPLRILPPERQQEMLGSLVSALIAEDTAPGTHPIRVPGRSPFGGRVELVGTRSIAAGGPLAHATTHAVADIPAPAGGARVELDTEDDIDSRTGLIASHTETLHTTLGTGADARVTERVSTVTVTQEPGLAWPQVP